MLALVATAVSITIYIVMLYWHVLALCCHLRVVHRQTSVYGVLCQCFHGRVPGEHQHNQLHSGETQQCIPSYDGRHIYMCKVSVSIWSAAAFTINGCLQLQRGHRAPSYANCSDQRQWNGRLTESVCSIEAMPYRTLSTYSLSCVIDKVLLVWTRRPLYPLVWVVLLCRMSLSQSFSTFYVI